MKFIVLSRRNAKAFLVPEDCKLWSAISITDYDENWPVLNATRRHSVLKIAFNDIETESHYPDEVLFTEDDAKKILFFVEENYDQVELFLVHCFAGVGRSPAIAAALSKIYLGDDSAFHENYPHLNKFIYQKMLETHRKFKNE